MKSEAKYEPKYIYYLADIKKNTLFSSSSFFSLIDYDAISDVHNSPIPQFKLRKKMLIN